MEWHIKHNSTVHCLHVVYSLCIDWNITSVCMLRRHVALEGAERSASFLWEYNLQYPLNRRSVGSRPSLSTLKNTITFSCQEPNYQSLIVQPGAHSGLFPCETIKKALYSLQYTICVKYCGDKEWLFHNTNVPSLLAKLTPEDCDKFSFYVKQLNWNKYHGNCGETLMFHPLSLWS